jgi:integrase/recombinase XerD
MPTKLTTTISKIASIPNSVNSELVNDFYEYMKSNGASERHQNNNLKVMIAYAKFLGTDVSFYNVQKKEQIMGFLDTKIKNTEHDPDKKLITTWNHNLHRIKHFIRWLYNQRCKKEEERVERSEWERIKYSTVIWLNHFYN